MDRYGVGRSVAMAAVALTVALMLAPVVRSITWELSNISAAGSVHGQCQAAASGCTPPNPRMAGMGRVPSR